jgi:Zn-dependent peptidase ImmA (M78 family)
MRKSNVTIEKHAADFLKKYNSDDTIPVPIEEMIEFKLGIHIVPIKDLLKEHQIDGFLSHDCKEISIDEDIYIRQTNRSRFTLAHETGHVIMHHEIIKAKINSIEDWKLHILGAGSGRAIYETEANIFAGSILMPTKEINRAYQIARKKVVESFESLNRTVPKDNTIIPYVASHIAKQFEVSEQAAEIRLKNLFE